MALSRDPIKENKRLAAKHHFDFPVLSDPGLALMKALGMVHPGAGPGGQDIARPATYVIDREGRVQWMHTASNIRERPDPEDVLEALSGLGP